LFKHGNEKVSHEKEKDHSSGYEDPLLRKEDRDNIRSIFGSTQLDNDNEQLNNLIMIMISNLRT